MVKALSQLVPGERGVVAKVAGKGAVCRRLLDMGIVPGTAVKVEKFAPLGDPMEIKVKGFNLSLRKSEAETIQVETA
jgi:Fe2+ transport system protein FeoA